MRCLSTGFEVALRWLWGGFVLRSLCLVYAYYMALGWLWVACRPSSFNVRGWAFDVRVLPSVQPLLPQRWVPGQAPPHHIRHIPPSALQGHAYPIAPAVV